MAEPSRIGKVIAVVVVLVTLLFTGYSIFLEGKEKFEEPKNTLDARMERAFGKVE